MVYATEINSTVPETRKADQAENLASLPDIREVKLPDFPAMICANATLADRAVALSQALGGAPVMPVCSSDKRPVLSDWPNSAPTDAGEIRLLFDLFPYADQIGLVTGPRSGISVLDVDNGLKGKEGDEKKLAKAESAKAWHDENGGSLPPTVHLQSRSGGNHYLFRHDPEITAGENKPVLGVDVRAKGSQIIFWAATGEGEVVRDGRLSDWPEHVKAQLPVRREKTAVKSVGSDFSSSWIEFLQRTEKLEAVQKALACIPNDAESGDERELWRNLGFACAHADTVLCIKGAADAWREWSRNGDGYMRKDGSADEADARLDEVIDGFDAGREGGITVATLMYAAFESERCDQEDRNRLLALREQGEIARVRAMFGAVQPLPTPDEMTGDGEDDGFKLAFDVKPDTTPHLWNGYIRAGTAAVLAAKSYFGKTVLMAGLACSVAEGRPFFGADCQQGPVFISEQEGASLLADNVRAWYAAHRLDGRGKPIAITDEPLELLDRASVQRLIRQVHKFNRQVADTHGRTKLVCIDTLSQCIGGQDEHSPAVMSLVAKHLDLIRRETGAAVLLLHHATENSDNSWKPRGHNALPSNVHSVITIADAGQDGLRKVAPTKIKGSALPSPLFFRILPQSFALNADGEASEAGVVFQVDSAAVAEAKAKASETRADFVVRLIKEAGGRISKSDLLVAMQRARAYKNAQVARAARDQVIRDDVRLASDRKDVWLADGS